MHTFHSHRAPLKSWCFCSARLESSVKPCFRAGTAGLGHSAQGTLAALSWSLCGFSLRHTWYHYHLFEHSSVCGAILVFTDLLLFLRHRVTPAITCPWHLPLLASLFPRSWLCCYTVPALGFFSGSHADFVACFPQYQGLWDCGCVLTPGSPWTLHSQ